MRREEPRWRRYARFWGADARRDSDEELAFHFDVHVGDLMRRGMTREDAEAEARRVFGDVSAIRAELHDLSRRRRLAGEDEALGIGRPPLTG